MHAGRGHLLLREDDRQLAGAVVAVVEEDHQIVRADQPHGLALAVDAHDRLDELVGHILVIGVLHGGRHVRHALIADALDQGVVGDLHPLPALVAVHGVVAADDRGDPAARLCEVLLELLDKALAAVRVGITAVHEAVHVGLVGHAVFAGDVAQFEEVLERRVHAAVRGQAHEVDADAVGAGVLERLDHLGILQDRVVTAGPVDLHEVLVDHAAGTDVEVSDLRVAHLSVGQSDILAVRAQLGVGILLGHGRDIGGVHRRNDVGLVVVADAPAVENHQKNFFVAHNGMIFNDYTGLFPWLRPPQPQLMLSVRGSAPRPCRWPPAGRRGSCRRPWRRRPDRHRRPA